MTAPEDGRARDWKPKAAPSRGVGSRAVGRSGSSKGAEGFDQTSLTPGQAGGWQQQPPLQQSGAQQPRDGAGPPLRRG